MGSIDAFAAETLGSYQQVDLARQSERRRLAVERNARTGGRRLTFLFPRFTGAGTLRAA